MVANIYIHTQTKVEEQVYIGLYQPLRFESTSVQYNYESNDIHDQLLAVIFFV